MALSPKAVASGSLRFEQPEETFVLWQAEDGFAPLAQEVVIKGKRSGPWADRVSRFLLPLVSC